MIVALARDEADWHQAGHLFVVADGMGAHAAGELASKLAVDQVGHLYRKHLDLSPPAAIVAAIKEANEEIHRRGLANLAFHNMGTTCSALVLLPQGAMAAHVGDSRVYRLRDGVLQQITFDHSLVWEMRQASDQKDVDPVGIPKNVITRSLGPHPNVKVDLEGPFATEVGDTFLLCSDGLTGCLNDEEIATVLANLQPTEASQLLVDWANLRGAPDNTTVIVAQVSGAQQTTRANDVAPLVIGESSEPTPTAPVVIWTGLGVLLLLAGVLWALGNSRWALIVLALAAIPGAWILAVELGLNRRDGVRLSGGRRLGRAPYQKATAGDSAALLAMIEESVNQVTDDSRQLDWDVDWDQFESGFKAAATQYGSSQSPEALLASVANLADHLRQFGRNADAK